MMTLAEEAKQATQMLQGRVVKQVWRHRAGELGIEFEDGTRLFADVTPVGLELSITGVEDDPIPEPPT